MTNMNYFEKVESAAESIVEIAGNYKPEIGLITGTGLGDIAQDITVDFIIPYQKIIGFPISTVQSHKGELILGKYNGIKVAVLSGRMHHYEGYNMKEITMPVRVLHKIGIQKLIITNVSGSVNEDFEMGDVVFIRDHINLLPDNPLRGINEERWGPRFPDMKDTYNPIWNKEGIRLAVETGLRAHQGVYVAFPGPNLETPAEYVFLNRIGGDLVGMSTVPEVIVAKHMELPLLVLSLVSNKCYPPEAIRETSLDDVLKVGKEKQPLLRKLCCKLFCYLAEK
jgi:purine-nucleoside phosphorylase